MQQKYLKSNSNISSVYILIIAVIFLYQQYSIYQLQTTVNSLLEKSDKTGEKTIDSKNIRHQYINSNNIYLHKKSPPPLGSIIQTKVAAEDKKRGIYGGKKDLPHLGGFTNRDNTTISENLFNFMLSELAVKSFVDIGCGTGII